MQGRSKTEMADIVPSVKKGGVSGHSVFKHKLVVALVGLPARGKTYIATKLAYYLNWIMVPTRVFNLGEYRRRKLGPESPAQFFHPDNFEGVRQRKVLARQAIEDVLQYLRNDGGVAIFDATNSTRERRMWLQRILNKAGVRVVFVESVCDDDQQIRNNIMDVKVRLPDYGALSVDAAVADFEERIKYYRMRYEPLSSEQDADCSFIKLVDVGRSVLLHRVQGYLQMRIARFLMSLHIKPRHIYITRHGESEFNTVGKIGGDSSLSPRGMEYAQRLKQFMDEQELPNLRVWCSSLKRTIQTAQNFDDVESWKALDELDAGLCDELTYKEVEEQFPDVYRDRATDKYWTRYPRGESYADVVQRLEPRILDLEQAQENVLVVCHQAVARCLLSYFQQKSDLASQLPYIKVDLHTVFKITPIPYGNLIEVFPLGIDAVSTYVPRIPTALLDSPAISTGGRGDDGGEPARSASSSSLQMKPSQVIVVSPAESAHMMHHVNPDSPVDIDKLFFGDDMEKEIESAKMKSTTDSDGFESASTLVSTHASQTPSQTASHRPSQQLAAESVLAGRYSPRATDAQKGGADDDGGDADDVDEDEDSPLTLKLRQGKE
ncbi:fructose-2,6-bisphosphatase [Salpingoeca rosetta]|uniref:Fructose-2,6-bisphosphatase n=1 Tax=Salpingoeca rosetta (strain ATCC 50818 / BSB-021) TaxID=946362 RepID=F2UMA7_SALR5|nr:fructose-2,6-bisphosphatase [Salpingoeca rosetta]EGD78256.1 fructose-2,6-bisphosphatase [Salpingoeca rosetta]|eukprot:XP_004989579.1 fructose-2,6-bisphosphatase [Salpingoeca rosetta]